MSKNSKKVNVAAKATASAKEIVDAVVATAEKDKKDVQISDAWQDVIDDLCKAADAVKALLPEDHGLVKAFDRMNKATYLTAQRIARNTDREEMKKAKLTKKVEAAKKALEALKAAGVDVSALLK